MKASNSTTNRSKPVWPPTLTSVTVGSSGVGPWEAEPPEKRPVHVRPAGGEGLGLGEMTVALGDAEALWGGGVGVAVFEHATSRTPSIAGARRLPVLIVPRPRSRIIT